MKIRTLNGNDITELNIAKHPQSGEILGYTGFIVVNKVSIYCIWDENGYLKTWIYNNSILNRYRIRLVKKHPHIFRLCVASVYNQAEQLVNPLPTEKLNIFLIQEMFNLYNK